MSTIEICDRPPADWFPLDVVKEADGRKGGWVALMIDVAPDDLKNCTVEFPALFYVDPKEYLPGLRKALQRWVRIPGNHRNKGAAWAAMENMIATKH